MKNEKSLSRRSFLGVFSKASISVIAITQFPSVFYASVKSKINYLIANEGGIVFFHIKGIESQNEFKNAAKSAGQKVKKLFEDIIGAINSLPSDNTNATTAQEGVTGAIVPTIISISFASGVATAASVATGGVIVAASLTPAIIAVVALAAIVAITILIIEIAKDRNVSIMVANLSKSSLKIDQVQLTENSSFALLESDKGISEASPLYSIIPQAQDENDGIVSTFLVKKNAASFDISGAIRIVDDYNNAYYIAWHSPTVGKNAIAVGMSRPTDRLINANKFRKQSITPGEKKMQQTVELVQDNKLFIINAALSDEDSEFPKAVVTIEGPLEKPAVLDVTFTFKNKSVFPAYFTIFKIRYIDSDGNKGEWKSNKIADGKSVSKTLPGDYYILSVNGRKLDGTNWKRIAKLDYNKTAIEIGSGCYEARKAVGNAVFKKVSC